MKPVNMYKCLTNKVTSTLFTEAQDIVKSSHPNCTNYINFYCLRLIFIIFNFMQVC